MVTALRVGHAKLSGARMERQQLRRDASDPDSRVKASDSPSKQQLMALIQTRTSTPLRPPLVAITDDSTVRPHARYGVASTMAHGSSTHDERSYLLAASSPPTPSSSSSQSDHRDRVHPYSYESTSPSRAPHQVDTSYSSDENTMSNSSSPTEGNAAVKILHAIVDHKQTQPFTRLLVRAQSMTASAAPTAALYVVNGSTAPPREQRRRHSILRVSSSKMLVEKPLRKCASVEFALHHEELQRISTEDRLTASSETPRRLTYEEKEELYKVRPDLEIGPLPFYKQQLEEMEQRNQRRMVFAVVGGMMCLMFLMVVYYILSLA